MLTAAQQAGIDVAAARAGVKVLDEFPFDDDRKRMSVLVEHEGKRLVALKGSPESTLRACSAIRRDGLDEPLNEAAKAALQQEEMSKRGLRVLALAERRLAAGEPDPSNVVAAETGLVFLGLVGLEDPPRAEAPAAVRALQDAGVRVMMVTGDHSSTALAIAEQVGIDTHRPAVRGSQMEWVDEAKLAEMVRETSVFARTRRAGEERVDIQPGTLHGGTQAQSAPVFAWRTCWVSS